MDQEPNQTAQITPQKPYRKKHKTATKKQLTALQLISTGMSKRQAMIKAGYSKNVANNPKKKLLESQAITSLMDKFVLELGDVGLTSHYIANKYAVLGDAKKTVIDRKTGQIIGYEPDHKIQLEVLRDLREIYKLEPAKGKEDSTPTRRITLEEFLS